jgi:hypothetical protein
LFLKELRDGFVGRLLGERKGPGEAKTPLRLEDRLFTGHLRDVLNPDNDNPASDYRPTWMFETRDSLFWAWRRTRELFNDWSDEANGYTEAYALIRS